MKTSLTYFSERSFTPDHAESFKYQNMSALQAFCVFRRRIFEEIFVVSQRLISRQYGRYTLNNSEGSIQLISTSIRKDNQGMQLFRRPYAQSRDGSGDFFQFLMANWVNPAARWQIMTLFIKQLTKGPHRKIGSTEGQFDSCCRKLGQSVSIFMLTNILSSCKPDRSRNGTNRSHGTNPICPLSFVKARVQPSGDQGAQKAYSKQRVSDNPSFEMVDFNCHKEILA